MVARKNLGIAERETLIAQAVLDVKSGKYKSAYHAEKVLGLPKSSVTRRVNGGLTTFPNSLAQQNLSGAQEKILLKCTTLRTANALLTTTINGSGGPSTPVWAYIQKLTVASEQLQTSIVYQLDASNLRLVMKRCAVRTKGKRVILKGHFHVSTQELCDVVVEVEKATQNLSKKKRKTKDKRVSSDDEIDEYIKEEAGEQSESDSGSWDALGVRL
ncbi:hypothetical protein VC83_04036 [Pseudogymnoascus destructans]|uniref:Uncharacterized protein n=1 Tax=Pseudogymnoascus destructans TaxID=655981 RepID=A0A177AEG6_9PEZI|nr:uncharacterized protein VC83_04036 [Pseudogymnoascus destructans]OAF59573.1 hypothetical protein VC83_04036 [Pseudogymnoascus destructans]